MPLHERSRQVVICLEFLAWSARWAEPRGEKPLGLIRSESDRGVESV